MLLLEWEQRAVVVVHFFPRLGSGEKVDHSAAKNNFEVERVVLSCSLCFAFLL